MLAGLAGMFAWLGALAVTGILGAAARLPMTSQHVLGTLIFLSASTLGGFIVGHIMGRASLLFGLCTAGGLLIFLQLAGAPWPHPLVIGLLTAGSAGGAWIGTQLARKRRRALESGIERPNG